MAQYGFYFDQSRCTGCQTCEIACRNWNGIPSGPVKWLRINEYETGAFPGVRLHEEWLTCYHCANPVCVDASNGAMFKEGKYGAVLIDPAKATSSDLKAAWVACPYGAIVFGSDAPDAAASKCTMCIDRLDQGLKPICVLSCQMRALDFDTIENLQKVYGQVSKLDDLPDPSTTRPSVVFKAQDPKKKVVVYDEVKALSLLATRDPLPSIYKSATDVTDLSEEIVSRNKSVVKPLSTQELLRSSETDDS